MQWSSCPWILLDLSGDAAISAAEAWLETGDPRWAGTWFHHLMNFVCREDPIPPLPGMSLWQSYLIHRILFPPIPAPSGNAPWTSATEAALGRDLRRLQLLWRMDSGPLAEALDIPPSALRAPGGETGTPPSPSPAAPHDRWLAGRMADLYHILERTEDWAAAARDCLALYAELGTGLPARYWVFKWDSRHRDLVPVRHPDPTTLADLVGYESQKQQVIQNTEQFVLGLPANNVLLYGDRGTGKSSLVKALVHEFGPRGLRLVEVSRKDLADFPAVVRLLRSQPHRFILFLDDLSFDEGETMYKDWKVLLEGGVERRPDNVLLYATSNRRHLVRERFSDRGWPERREDSDDLHLEDTVQEKLSLADRFGLTVSFFAPDQELFLEMALCMARRLGLPVEEDELRRRALQWERRHNGRSGRSARQFIDHLAGEVALAGMKKGALPQG